MPDYDSRSIPTLDDIIENDLVDELKDEIEIDLNDDAAVAESHQHIFAENSKLTANDKDEPQIGIINDFDEDDSTHIESLPLSQDDTEAELAGIRPFTSQSETDMPVETKDQSGSTLVQDPHEPESSEAEADFVGDDDAIDKPANQQTKDTPPPIEPLPLQAIVEDIVKQLMPDLEQQLRYLVQQALEDKLSNAALNQLNIKSDDN